MTGTDKPSVCVFCDSQGPERNPLVLVRGRVSYVVLNLYPYNSGHVMVVPDRHIASLAAATHAELDELILFTRDAEVALTEVYQSQGINVGLNLGQPAGAGVLEHVHIHLVPRWTGDTNFMSVFGNVRVLPEELSESAKRLRPVFERLARQPRG